MPNILHKIKAYLYKNSFSKDENNYTARIMTNRPLNLKEICSSAATRGGADISASAMQHAAQLFLKEMEYLLCDGYSVNTGSFMATPTIKGVFHSPTESFNSEKHTLSFQFTQGKSLRKKRSIVEIEVAGMADNHTYISQVTDLESNTINEQITPRHLLRINGRRIKLAGDHPQVGIYFIDKETGLRTKIEKSKIITNYPSEVIIMTPPLTPGTYLLELSSQFTTAGILKQPNTAMFEHELIVL